MRRWTKMVNVIDLETTCWEPPEVQGKQLHDIIEIGIATVDTETLLITETESIMVVPERSQVGDFCTRLTTITPQDVSPDNAKPFVVALEALTTQYKAADRLWISYGDFDRKMFERQCADFKLQYPFGPRHLNIKNLVSLLYGWPKEYGMARTLETLAISLEGTHHRGVDDAYNTAKLLIAILKRFRQNIA